MVLDTDFIHLNFTYSLFRVVDNLFYGDHTRGGQMKAHMSNAGQATVYKINKVCLKYYKLH